MGRRLVPVFEAVKDLGGGKGTRLRPPKILRGSPERRLPKELVEGSLESQWPVIWSYFVSIIGSFAV